MPPDPPELTIRASQQGDTTTLVLAGEIDLLTSTQLNRELDIALDRKPAALRLELADVVFMDTSGVAVLLKARRRALEVGCHFGVASMSPPLARLFEITGLAGMLTE
jgi:anti-anti-sigma factor